MDQKIKTICLEVGLAIALVVSLSLLGAKMGSEHQKKEAKLELAEAENKAAAGKRDGGVTGGEAAENAEGGSGASDPDAAPAPETEEVIATDSIRSWEKVR